MFTITHATIFPRLKRRAQCVRAPAPAVQLTGDKAVFTTKSACVYNYPHFDKLIKQLSLLSRRYKVVLFHV